MFVAWGCNVTDEKSIQKYGGNRMYFAPPIDFRKQVLPVLFCVITGNISFPFHTRLQNIQKLWAIRNGFSPYNLLRLLG
jgi:hypothetical protein